MIKKLRLSIILIPSAIFAVLIIIGFADSESFIAVLNQAFEALMVNCGWLVSLGVTAFVIFMLVLLFHPIGKIKLGGPDAKPTMNYWQWFSVSLCAGIGSGCVFWGAAEPLLHTMDPSPSLGYASGSNEAVIWGMRTTFLHWTFAPYAIYVTFGVILAYIIYNMRKPNTVSSGFVTLLGDKALKGKASALIDALTVFAIVGGVAGSLGYGILQIGYGLDNIFGVKETVSVLVIVCVVIVIAYVATSISGLKKGTTWLGDKSTKASLILLVFILVAGPTSYILNLITQSTGSFLANFLESITYTAPFSDSELWPQWWDMYWWTDWLSFGPVMGLFYAKLGYGRSVREFVIVNWVLPSVFGIFWFGIFGGTALNAQLMDGINLFSVYEASGAKAMTFSTVGLLPLGNIIKPIMLIIIAVSLVNLSNSMTSTVASMSLKDSSSEEAPAAVKIFWGAIIGGACLVFTLTGGIDGIKMVKTFAGFPILFVGLIMLIGFCLHMHRQPKGRDGKYLDEEALSEKTQGK